MRLTYDSSFPCSLATFGSGPRPQRRAVAGSALRVSPTQRTTCGSARDATSCPRRHLYSPTGACGAILRFPCLTVHSSCLAHVIAPPVQRPGLRVLARLQRLCVAPRRRAARLHRRGQLHARRRPRPRLPPLQISWYRKHFNVDAAAAGGLVSLEFDGVYRASTFWL